MEYPLEGIRILEWGIFHAGPGATAILGDLGAEVVKIEQRGKGDPIRHRGRFGRTSFDLPGGRNLFFEGSNRNKKSICVDLSKDMGKDIVYRLIPRFDVFLTNLRRRTREEMAMTYPILSDLNRRLIYISVSSYGPRGPDRDQGGFDFQGQARSGMMYSMGEPGTPPVLSQFGLIDQATAIVVSQAILAALFMRERTGKGQMVDASILGSALYLSYFNLLNALWLHQDVPRHRRMDTDPIRNYYQCKDGKWFAITLRPDGDWSRFCQAIEHVELERDPRFDTREKRSEERSTELITLLSQMFLAKTRDDWLETFRGYDLFACAVHRHTELENDPQIRENYLDELDHPTLGTVNIPGFPAHFSEARAGTRKAAPGLGEHTEEILRTFGGYGEHEIEQLKKEEVI
ncbi:MAG: CoA transferase [Pseudomonadota bacterium]